MFRKRSYGALFADDCAAIDETAKGVSSKIEARGSARIKDLI